MIKEGGNTKLALEVNFYAGSRELYDAEVEKDAGGLYALVDGLGLYRGLQPVAGPCPIDVNCTITNTESFDNYQKSIGKFTSSEVFVNLVDFFKKYTGHGGRPIRVSGLPDQTLLMYNCGEVSDDSLSFVQATIGSDIPAGADISDYVIATISYTGSSDSGNIGTHTTSTNSVSSVDQFSFDPSVVNKLQVNVTGGIKIKLEKQHSLVVDLAGHKWTADGNVIALATGSIYVYDSVGGGKIVSTGNDAISMGNGEVKFKNITIEAKQDNMDAIYCDGGNLTVENCTLSAPKAGIHVANGSEAVSSSARAVVTIINGTFAKSTVLDSHGKNCAIQIRNNADEITLKGSINFENNKIISEASNTKSIKDAITIAQGSTATFTAGYDLVEYTSATLHKLVIAQDGTFTYTKVNDKLPLTNISVRTLDSKLDELQDTTTDLSYYLKQHVSPRLNNVSYRLETLENTPRTISWTVLP